MIKYAFVLVLSLFAQISWADTVGNWNNLSNLLAVGLPAVAGGYSLYEDDKQGVLELGLSLGSTFAATEALKYQFPETRPDNSGNDSFPSGHTAIAFAAARYLDKRYSDENYGVYLYGAAALTGIARVEADKHHWSDVLVGGALGFGMSELFTSNRNTQLVVLPYKDGIFASWTQKW